MGFWTLLLALCSVHTTVAHTCCTLVCTSGLAKAMVEAAEQRVARGVPGACRAAIRVARWVAALAMMLGAVHTVEGVQMEGTPAAPRWATRWRLCDELEGVAQQFHVTNVTVG